ncbi:bacteriocin [Lacticaseibacillus zeae]|uniref:Bacteriocin n=2 Tax=Lacticaseibacillus zeae TaxID=57037 RepID=A0A5R8LMY1_LACZE|nr:bacteriocin [Lacticaseibacillus zeae]OLS06778.1 hypothetical protein AUQ39_09805 [Lacticaseibacillus casei]KRK13282.1 hypothetical protein FD51_GL001485 [Lacticaseibacillus zeae DSM 20178 = KCTC 3804]MDE3316214.1 bacteriocin [Lacticaseibacillus zeae]QVI32112.1 bacteriocin [Lacticaseibacillus zeae]TLF38545.1 bacteriocin [Lacticaseibacillus zeae]
MFNGKVTVLSDTELSTISGGDNYYDYKAAGEQAYQIGRAVGKVIQFSPFVKVVKWFKKH